ncbi:hypothetical protein SKAU_G00091690 [Synaphobranchus kaupii]|uniref:Uncharacterized protein n=1 Tax=Synaphobranchus kaupii TaxID=118154 RepID=A0A9Q1FXQ2_SYNKA|nr:hypothetical protein SKAU_G00091690 [Synaphobranchus kaupii]
MQASNLLVTKLTSLRSSIPPWSPIMGDKHEIQCVEDNEGRQVLFQVKIPLYRNFTIGCYKYDQGEPADVETSSQVSSGHPCPRNVPVFYFPISYEHPRRAL